MKTPKSLTKQEAQRVRLALRGLLEQYGTQQKLARQLRTSQQTVSGALHGSCGVNFARKLAAVTGQSFDELVTGQARPAALRDDPRWAAAEQEARRRNRSLPDQAFEGAGALIPGSSVPNLDASFVAGLAKTWWAATVSGS